MSLVVDIEATLEIYRSSGYRVVGMTMAKGTHEALRSELGEMIGNENRMKKLPNYRKIPICVDHHMRAEYKHSILFTVIVQSDKWKEPEEELDSGGSGFSEGSDQK